MTLKSYLVLRILIKNTSFGFSFFEASDHFPDLCDVFIEVLLELIKQFVISIQFNTKILVDLCNLACLFNPLIHFNGSGVIFVQVFYQIVKIVQTGQGIQMSVNGIDLLLGFLVHVD